MKTSSIIDKYRKTISGILKCNEEDIEFYVDGKLIGEITYDKKDREFEKHWSLGSYRIVQCFEDNIKKEISTFKLYQLQHCCAFMVSCNVNVTLDYRNKRIGTLLNTLRQDIGRLLGYSGIICTDVEQNIHQRKLLKTNGWKDVHNVVNKRTNNRVYLSVINL